LRNAIAIQEMQKLRNAKPIKTKIVTEKRTIHKLEIDLN
jgi:hypothetical protein